MHNSGFETTGFETLRFAPKRVLWTLAKDCQAEMGLSSHVSRMHDDGWVKVSIPGFSRRRWKGLGRPLTDSGTE